MFGFIHKFPYSNFHEINLDWLINSMKALQSSFTELSDKVDDAVIYMKDNIYQTTTEIINEAIEAGSINVGVTYTALDERIDIIVTQ